MSGFGPSILQAKFRRSPLRRGRGVEYFAVRHFATGALHRGATQGGKGSGVSAESKIYIGGRNMGRKGPKYNKL